MKAFNPRYYAFVTRFVDAVSTDALSSELGRLRRCRLFEAATLSVTEARGTIPAPVEHRQAA